MVFSTKHKFIQVHHQCHCPPPQSLLFLSLSSPFIIIVTLLLLMAPAMSSLWLIAVLFVIQQACCTTHSSMHWCTTNSALFNGGKEGAKLFKERSRCHPKICLHINCVDFLCNMIVKKWRENGEKVTIKK